MAAILGGCFITGCYAMQVDGVSAEGGLQNVSVRDIRNAIGAASNDSTHKVSRVVVVNADEMRVYLKPTTLGWLVVKRAKLEAIPPCGFLEWLTRKLAPTDPRVLHAINTADEVGIFPVSTPTNPRRNDKRLRLLGLEARQKVKQLLGNKLAWWHGGGYTMIRIVPEPPNIGLVFRGGRDELVMFFSGGFGSGTGYIEGALNGQYISEMLDDKPSEKMEAWARRYAKAELGVE